MSKEIKTNKKFKEQFSKNKNSLRKNKKLHHLAPMNSTNLRESFLLKNKASFKFVNKSQRKNIIEVEEIKQPETLKTPLQKVSYSPIKKNSKVMPRSESKRRTLSQVYQKEGEI